MQDDPRALVNDPGNMLDVHPESPPLVSVIMSNYNGASYLEAAVASVLGQSHRILELIVVDDASQDGSLAILQQMAASDHRLKLIALDTNAGPAGARNTALDAARGVWIAIVDADDFIHPRRIERLISAARATGVDMIADDLVSFGYADTAGRTLLENRRVDEAMRVNSIDLIHSDTVGMGLESLGYLKPMIRRDVLGQMRYTETLRIGEDFDLYARLLFRGASFLTVPNPTYLYRRHTGSASNRLSVPVLEQLVQAHDAAAALADMECPDDRDLQAALFKRRTRMVRALFYQQLVEAIKLGKGRTAAAYVMRNPVLLVDLWASLTDRLRRGVFKKRDQPPPNTRTVVLAAQHQLASVTAPPNAIFLPVDPVHTPETMRAASHRALACNLAKLASQTTISIVAVGHEGLDGLGYVPVWQSAQVWLDLGSVHEATVPQGVTLELIPEGC